MVTGVPERDNWDAIESLGWRVELNELRVELNERSSEST